MELLQTGWLQEGVRGDMLFPSQISQRMAHDGTFRSIQTRTIQLVLAFATAIVSFSIF